MHSVLAAVALASGFVPAVLAQGVPLASKHFTWGALPYQADTDTGERGTQYGYNLCNSTTEGPTSLCQTAIINSIDDFCLWGPPEKDSLIGNTEGESIAWCTKPGYGTRIIPKGAITGVQFMKTPDYVQVTGFIKQQYINIQADDSGGELDPHGADQRGNPLGGLLFSNAFNGQFVQAVEWHNFMGGGTFCLKACDPAGPNAAHYCEHVFDRIGCQYNAPAAYVDGKFESCLGDSQDFPGIYTGANGVVSTYSQPPESLGPITSIPYTARIPASSSCTPYTSSLLWTDAPAPTGVTSSASTTTRTGTGTTRPTSTRATTSSSPTSSTGAAFAGATVKLPLLVAGFFGLVLAL